MDNILITYRLQIFVIIMCLIFTLFFILCDLWSGIRKSKKNGDFISSHGLRRTIDKMNKYYNILLIFILVDILQCFSIYSINNSYRKDYWVFPFLTVAITIIIAAIEIKSIYENMDKKTQKDFRDTGKTVIGLMRTIKKEQPELFDKIINTAIQNNKTENNYENLD